MAEHHYLGFRCLVGESMKYVAELNGEWQALIGWGTAAFKCGPRDRWIGWTQSQQWRRLRFVANNMRFLVLPGIRRPHLASQVLGRNLRRLSRDWEAVFSHPIVLAETFVDPRFAGTCYRAAGWEPLGSTQGFGRSAGKYVFHGHPKTIWVRPLETRSRELLSAPFDHPALYGGPQPTMPDLNRVLDPEQGLIARLAAVPDSRRKRGIRHQQAVILAVAACASIAGMRSFTAIGEWAAALPQEALERLGCRRHPVRSEYIPPCESTLRRTLQAVDVERMDREIGAWMEAQAPSDAVAVDGKTLRGAKRRDGTQVHLLSALVHKQGVTIGQRDVNEKHNEITEFKPLLEPLDLTGRVVTADAMHTQAGHARFLVDEKQADYLFIAKDNQPTLHLDIKHLSRESFSPSGD